jgi:transglutaminase-like putative cysteine protease
VRSEHQIDTGGASRVWTSDEPYAIDWRTLIDRGEFQRAEQLILRVTRELNREKDANATQWAREAHDMLTRIRWAYSADRGSMFNKLRETIPDLSTTELDAWVQDGALDVRRIDGVEGFFRREPGRVLRTYPTAMSRKAQADRAKADTDRHSDEAGITEHLRSVIAASQASDEVELLPVRTRFEHELRIKSSANVSGETVKLWLPYPQVYRQQRDVVTIEQSNIDFVAPETTPQRTCFGRLVACGDENRDVAKVIFSYRTSAYYPRLDPKIAQHGSDARLVEFLKERKPHIVFSDRIKRISREVAGVGENPLEAAYRLWVWVDENFPWVPEHEYGDIPSLSEWALDRRCGDCGVVAMLYITLCRCAGIPARWQSGFVTDPDDGGNMHDWCEIHVEPWGWIPVDPSYGRKRDDDPRVRDFYFGHTDRYRLIVNTDYGRPLDPPKTFLRSEPADFQRGEVETDTRNLYFPEWGYRFTFSHEEILRDEVRG